MNVELPRCAICKRNLLTVFPPFYPIPVDFGLAVCSIRCFNAFYNIFEGHEDDEELESSQESEEE